MSHWNREKIVESLKKISQKIDHPLSTREAGMALYQASRLYFGSFNKAKQIAGLSINLPKHHQINKNAWVLNRDLAYIIGVIEGDGHCRKRETKERTSGEIILKVKDLDFAKEFENRLRNWAGAQPKFWERNGFFNAGLYSIDAVNVIQNIDLEKILDSDKRIKANFLRGMYDSEGGVTGANLNKRKVACRWIHFSNNNKTIIKIVSKLLNDFGISHKIRTRIHSGFKSKKLQYEILIFGQENLKRFYKNIGFSIKRKMDKLLKIINSYGKHPITIQSSCI